MILVLLWNLGNLVLFAASLTRQSDSAAVLGRYSTGYALGLAFSLALMVTVALLTLTPPGRRLGKRIAARLNALIPQRGAGLVALVVAVIIALSLLWALPLDLGYVEQLVLFNLVMAAVLLNAVSASSCEVPRLQVHRLLWVLLILVLAVAFFSAHAVPHEQGHGDEAAWANMADTLRSTGQAYIRISGHSPAPIPPGVGWWVAPLALWQSVFGVSLATGRTFIWLFYLASVASIGWAGARLYDRTTGLIAALLTAASLFMLTYRIIRPEIGLAAIGALLMVFYLAGKKRPLWAFAAGWLAILSLEIHAAGLAYIIALILMYATDALQALLQRRNPFAREQFAAIAGLVWGSLIYVAIHILIQPDPASYFTFLRSSRAFLEELPADLISTVITSFWGRSSLELILAAAAIIVMCVRHTAGDRLVLRFFLFTLVAYLLLVPTPESYLVILMPLMALGMASLLTFGVKPAVEGRASVYSLIAAAALCAPFFAVALPGVSPNPMPATALTPVMQRARELSTPDEVVAGDGFAWWGLTDYPRFFATWAEYEATRNLGDVASDRTWDSIQPSLMFLVYYPGFPEMPRVMRDYLAREHFEVVDSFEWEGHRVEFYRRPES